MTTFSKASNPQVVNSLGERTWWLPGDRYYSITSQARLQELAEMLGMADPAVLAQTVTDYNAACEAGIDAEYGKDAAFLKTLGNEGPWYAFFGEAEPYGSDGGLSIDHDFRVTRTDGSVIGGVYAAGTDCMGYQPAPFGGTYQGWAFMTGRLAGDIAAREALGM